MSAADQPPFAHAWRSVAGLSSLVVGAGAVGMLAEIEVWAWIVVTTLILSSALSITIAIVAYRRTMRRPWPEVAPISDDDWDD